MELQELLSIVINAILPVAIAAITAILSYLGTKIKKYIDGLENSAIIKDIIEDTVQYIEMVYKDLKGTEKLNEALKSITSQLESKGITINADELRIKIEAAVYKLTNKTEKGEK